jgi:N-acetyl-gamma-glutamylphosphate reductase
MSERIPTLIVGGTGYVAGELLRLVAGHPQLELHGVSSETAAGTAVSAAFPHLARLLKAEGFITQADLAARMTAPRMALLPRRMRSVQA